MRMNRWLWIITERTLLAQSMHVCWGNDTALYSYIMYKCFWYRWIVIKKMVFIIKSSSQYELLSVTIMKQRHGHHRCTDSHYMIRNCTKAFMIKTHWHAPHKWHRQCRYTLKSLEKLTSQWRHNEHDGVLDHMHYDCLLNCLFRPRSKKASKLRVTGLCVGNSHVTGEFPAQRVSKAENVLIWWCHHGIFAESNASVCILYVPRVVLCWCEIPLSKTCITCVTRKPSRKIPHEITTQLI